MTWNEAQQEVEREARALWRDVYRETMRTKTTHDARCIATCAAADFSRWASARLNTDRDIYSKG